MMFTTYVSEDRCTLVRVWISKEGDLQVEVATREDPDGIWGPPVLTVEER